MKRYVIINEYPVELSTKAVKSNTLFDALCVNGLQNGNFEEIAICETMEQARDELKKYKSSACLSSGYANVKFYSAEIYYIEEQEYDEEYDEWQPTGDYEAAAEEIGN